MAVHQPKIAGGPVELGAAVSAIDPAELPQRSHKRRHAGLNFRVGLGPRHQHTDPPHPIRLLRARRERPGGRRAAEQCDELAALHSLTSSAAASRVAGTVRPSAFAVLRLITNSNFTVCWIGKVEGFSPLRTRAV